MRTISFQVKLFGRVFDTHPGAATNELHREGGVLVSKIKVRPLSTYKFPQTSSAVSHK